MSIDFNRTKHKASLWYNLVLIEDIVGNFLKELLCFSSKSFLILIIILPQGQ